MSSQTSVQSWFSTLMEKLFRNSKEPIESRNETSYDSHEVSEFDKRRVMKFNCPIVKKLKGPRVAWKPFCESIARVVIPKGATIVKPEFTHLMRSNRIYIDEFTSNDGAGGVKTLGEASFTGNTFRTNHMYRVPNFDTKTRKILGDCERGIYFYARKSDAEDGHI